MAFSFPKYKDFSIPTTLLIKVKCKSGNKAIELRGKIYEEFKFIGIPKNLYKSELIKEEK